MHCIDLTSKRSKKLSYVPKLQKQSNSYQFASIWRQNDQKCWDTSQNILNNAKLQNWSNYNELHRFDVKTVKNRKTTKGIKLRSICIDLTSKRSKMLSYVAKHSKQRKTTKLIKLQWIASIWCQNDQNNAKLQTRANYDEFASIWHQNYNKCWGTSQNIQNNAKLENWSNYNELHRFDVKNIKPTQNYKSDLISMNLHRFDQIIMHCIDLTSKRSKKLSYVPKLQKWSNYNELHRFDVKTIKNVE